MWNWRLLRISLCHIGCGDLVHQSSVCYACSVLVCLAIGLLILQRKWKPGSRVSKAMRSNAPLTESNPPPLTIQNKIVWATGKVLLRLFLARHFQQLPQNQIQSICLAVTLMRHSPEVTLVASPGVSCVVGVNAMVNNNRLYSWVIFV